jgi:dihydroorotase
VPAAGEVIDCTGLHILPGVVDSQVHFREPGLEHKEDLETGSRAAVMGGVTAVFEMPNTKPLTTSEAALADKVARATNRMHCDFAFWVGGTRDNAGMSPNWSASPAAPASRCSWARPPADLLVEDDEGVFSILKNTRRRAAFHSEDEFRLRERSASASRATRPRIRSGATRLRRCNARNALWRIARRAGAHPCPAHLDRRGDRLPRHHKDVATCEARRTT